VSEKKIIKDFRNEVPPVDIPSADEAWSNMKEKLQEDEKDRPLVGWIWLYPVAIIMVLTGWWLFRSGDIKDQHLSGKEIKLEDSTKLAAGEKNNPHEEKQNQSQEEEKITGLSLDQKETNGTSIEKNFANTKHSIKTSREHGNVPGNDYNAESIPVERSSSPVAIINNYEKDGLQNNIAEAGLKDKDSVAPAIMKIKDDSLHMADEPVRDDEDKIKTITTAGVEWNVQVPLTSVDKYFAGPNGSSQPYRLLLPGFWITVQAEKNMFTAQVNPFASSVLSDKPYSIKNVTNGTDAFVETRTLNKVFGLSASLAVDHNIKDKWWAGGNINGSFWQKGTVTIKGEKINTTSGIPSFAYETNDKLSDSAWSHFTKFQMGLGAQLFYKLPKWQAGMRFNFSFAGVIDQEGQRNLTTLQLFARWQLYTGEKKK
jgi:hypothetical protein